MVRIGFFHTGLNKIVHGDFEVSELNKGVDIQQLYDKAVEKEREKCAGPAPAQTFNTQVNWAEMCLQHRIDIQKLEEQLKSKDALINTLEFELKAKKERLSNAMIELSNVHNKKNEHKGKLQNCQTDLKTLKGVLENRSLEYQESLKEKEDHICKLITEVAEINNKLSEANELMTEQHHMIVERNKRIEELKKTNEALGKEASFLNKKINEYYTKIKDLENGITITGTHEHTVEIINHGGKSLNDLHEESPLELNKKNALLNLENIKLKAEIEELKKQLAEPRNYSYNDIITERRIKDEHYQKIIDNLQSKIETTVREDETLPSRRELYEQIVNLKQTITEHEKTEFELTQKCKDLEDRHHKLYQETLDLGKKINEASYYLMTAQGKLK